MDKSWINKPRLSQDYRLGVKNFLDFAFGKSNAPMVKCPFTRCSLAKSKTREDIEGYLICHGFLSSYTSWIVHGEDMCVTENARVPSDSAHVELDSTFNLLDDIFPDISANMNEEHEEGLSGNLWTLIDHQLQVEILKKEKVLMRCLLITIKNYILDAINSRSCPLY